MSGGITYGTCQPISGGQAGTSKHGYDQHTVWNQRTLLPYTPAHHQSMTPSRKQYVAMHSASLRHELYELRTATVLMISKHVVSH